MRRSAARTGIGSIDERTDSDAKLNTVGQRLGYDGEGGHWAVHGLDPRSAAKSIFRGGDGTANSDPHLNLIDIGTFNQDHSGRTEPDLGVTAGI